MMSHRTLRWFTVLGVAGALVVSTETAFARCRSVFLSLFPQGQAAPLNTRVLLHGGGELVRLAPVGTFVLRGPGGVIDTRVVFDAVQSGASLGQRTIVLAPTSPLRANTEYRVSVTSPAMRTALAFDMRGLRFRTGTTVDNTAPVVRSVRAGQFSSAELGCGPANTLPIHVDASDDGRTLVARLRVAATDADLAAGRLLMQSIEPVRDGAVQFGHSMCSGNFNLVAGSTYAAELTVIDIAGNEAAPVRLTLRS
jgi:hypothetical protein